MEVGKKLYVHLTSNTKLTNELSGEVKLISSKGLTKDVVHINGYIFLMVENILLKVNQKLC